MRAQGGLKQCRLEISEENRLLLKNNIEQLNKAEHRDSDVQTKVGVGRAGWGVLGGGEGVVMRGGEG